MKLIIILLLRGMRKVYNKMTPRKRFCIYNDYVEISGQKANDYVYQSLLSGKPLMVSKFGSVELGVIVAFELNIKKKPISFYYNDYMHGLVDNHRGGVIRALCNNAGFFPCNVKQGERFYRLMIEDIKQVDILASYIYKERYIAHYMNCKRIDLDGYYAPFLWKHPWTKYLEGKKVLVVHPFVESIRKQYETKRELLFDNKEVLPKFKELITVKAVQTIAGNQDSRFKDWFEALQYMKDEIDKQDYDVALIGCGAYGMCLAAHVKRMGKQAVHLAGWTQMLFGVYGNRWKEDQPQYFKFVNEHWIRPSDSERPNGAERVENGCYW